MNESTQRIALAKVDPRKVLLADVGLSARAALALRDAGYRTLGDVCARSGPELLRASDFGRVGLAEVTAILADRGLYPGCDRSIVSETVMGRLLSIEDRLIWIEDMVTRVLEGRSS